MKEAKNQMAPAGQASYKEFEDFLNLYDMEEALGSFLGKSEIVIQNNVQFLDTNELKAQAQGPKKPVYRDYSALRD